ncbi:formyltetrahydrofolate deformylase [Phaeodactylibacter sp.]|jgi:formyltetrahydrofolate deformylase|uniref:formyltetrahydrofolate deformylase n=1 Tax=Phaeodactylibacter sp. TaxID=1940289 RepID=UPI0025F5ABBC|nr:formyltetrahydrofolate deformylase [Phaeodactylibacter sp.]MCI4649543.1 formyltetrahydrofolate deformylase [Phaeodactylibacter sp.]MCI5092151.1 formyltetrahydrofolate deformylase [Phaeodactylibacter sp.]
MKKTAILLIHCPDQTGLVAAVTDFLHRNNGNVISLDQHVDRQAGRFFMRVEWELEGFNIPAEKIDEYFGTLIGQKYQMEWQVHLSAHKPRMAIFVSKMSHCLYDILQRCMSGEWEVEIPVIVSNHENLRYIAERFEIPFEVFPITKTNKAEQEQREIELMRKLDIDFIVLARYMQILSDDFVAAFPNQVINIHHSFLPAFKGAKPYHSAFNRGVKVIGATSHYVTADLDEGPIIEQDVRRISHKDTIQDLIRIGKDLEKVVLARAIWLEIQHKILPYQNKTIVFD